MRLRCGAVALSLALLFLGSGSVARAQASEAEAVAQLESRKAAERVQACQDLAGTKNTAAVSRLDVLARTDPAQEVRAAAARSLVASGGRLANDTVQQLLREGSADVRRRIYQGLEDVGPRSLGFYFIGLGDEESANRALAARGLGRWGDARMVPHVRSLAGDKDAYVRQEAVRALVSLAAREPSTAPVATVPEVLQFPFSDSDRRRSLAELAMEAGDAVRERLKDAAPSVRKDALAGLIKLGVRGLDEVLARAITDEDREVRAAASDALMVHDGAEAPTVLGGLARHGNSEVRLDALERLKGFGERALDQMLLFLDDSADFIRRRAVELLGKYESPRVYSRLADLLDDPDEEVRRRVAEALGRPGLTAMARRLGSALKDASPAVRRVAVQSLSAVGGPDVLRLLAEAAQDPDPGVRQAYVAALGAIGGEEASTRLLDQLCEPQTVYGEEVERALRKLKDAAIRPLVDRVESTGDNPLAQRRIVALLGDLRAREAVEPLTALVSSGTPEARDAAIDALGRIGDVRALPALERYYVSASGLSAEEHDRLRGALGALGRSFVLDLEARRYAVEALFVVVGAVVLMLCFRGWRRVLGDGAIAQKPEAPGVPATMAEVVGQCEAHIRSSRDTAGTSFYRRGLIHFSQGALAEAKRDLEDALRLCPVETQAHVLFVLGHIHRAKGDLAYAFRQYTQALRLRDKRVLGEVMSRIAAESPNDLEGNLGRVLQHLPYHGAFTLERILGEQPWEASPSSDPAVAQVLAARDPEDGDEPSKPARKVPWADDVPDDVEEPLDVRPLPPPPPAKPD